MRGTATRILESVTHALALAEAPTEPYPHWLMSGVLPKEVGRAVCALPFAPPAVGDTEGRRETHNESRVFFSPENIRHHVAMASIAEAFQSGDAIGLFDEVCGTDLAGSYLRIEYCQDRDGFWLEPHTDISAKLLTMLVYLSTSQGAAEWGTDVYDADLALVHRSPGGFNCGLVFVPASNTWHGFARRPINGIRRSLIINYVKPEWRARHELAYPETPVG